MKKVDFYSHILKKEMSMSVYLPANYNNATSLPVLYFLHGRSGDENLLFQIKADAVMDRLVNDGIIKPMIIVCPRIENSRGINSSLICREVSDVNNRIISLGMYESYFVEEVIPLVDATFKTVEDRRERYIGGASAGGYAALHYAFRYQHLFSKVGGHMPALELKLEEEDVLYFENMNIWEKYNPISIAESTHISSDVCVYLDAGDKDEGRFYEGCSILHEILCNKGVNSKNQIFPGHHNIEYIQSHFEKYLKFYGE